MIPLEIENVPKGFIWKIESENEYSCKISASILLYMILQNIFFSGSIQMIIAVITIVLYSSVIHIIHIVKKQ